MELRRVRLGRIILALLAPLVSFTPALKADLAATGNPAAADSLASLLRASVPMAAAFAVETGHSNSSSAPHAAASSFTPHVVIQAQAVWAAATEASLRLLARRYNRAQLRC
ncbi:MAG: hypothetical protein M3N41_03265 [Acidobacteriota bacterium]|nr:hypothetical protein [Acidobacteriota bacterium]